MKVSSDPPAGQNIESPRSVKISSRPAPLKVWSRPAPVKNLSPPAPVGFQVAPARRGPGPVFAPPRLVPRLTVPELD